MSQQPNSDGQNQRRQRPARAKNRSTKKSKPFILQKLRRQDIILLTGLASLACFSVIVVGFLILRFQTTTRAAGSVPLETPGPQPTHTVAFTQITGLNQYPLAEAEAKAWASDAQLASASANWPVVLSKEQLGEPGEWTYRFYSPGKERLLIVRVKPDGQVRAIEHIIKITLPPPALGTGNWIIDSPAALATWLDYGGGDLIVRNPGLEALIQLRHLNNYPNPVWVVIGTDERTQDLLIVVIDTTDGSVVRVNSSG